MSSRKLTAIAAFTVGVLGFTPWAAAQDSDSQGSNWFSDLFKTDWSKDFAFSFGTKVWINEWTTWNTAGIFNFDVDIDGDGISDFADDNLDGLQVTSHTADNWEVVPIPVASVRWKNLFVSGSYFPDTDYSFDTVGDFEREEFDVAMGYYVLPPYLALTAGYKYINQKVGPDDFDFDGPTVGFVGAVPMKHGFSLYSTFGYGFLEVDSAFFEGSGLDDDRESNYWLVEAGIAWTYNVKETAPHLLLNAATVTLGYRHQQVETEGVGAPFNNDDDGIDTTRGVALGVNFTF